MITFIAFLGLMIGLVVFLVMLERDQKIAWKQWNRLHKERCTIPGCTPYKHPQSVPL